MSRSGMCGVWSAPNAGAVLLGAAVALAGPAARAEDIALDTIDVASPSPIAKPSSGGAGAPGAVPAGVLPVVATTFSPVTVVTQADIVRQHPDVEAFTSSVGGTASSSLGGPNYGQLVVRLKPRAERDASEIAARRNGPAHPARPSTGPKSAPRRAPPGASTSTRAPSATSRLLLTLRCASAAQPISWSPSRIDSPCGGSCASPQVVTGLSWCSGVAATWSYRTWGARDRRIESKRSPRGRCRAWRDAPRLWSADGTRGDPRR